MRMDFSIPQNIQGVDVVGAIDRGTQAASNYNALRQQNALVDLYRTQGAGIMAGDPTALNALSGYSPEAALGIQSAQLELQGQRQDMQATQQRMDMLSREEQRQLEAFKKEKGAAAAAAAAADLENSVKSGLAIPDAATWDQYMSQNQPDLVGQFNNRQAIANRYLSMADVLKQNEPPKAPDLTADQKDYNFYSSQETSAGRAPLSFNEWTLQSKRAGATTVNVGGPSDPAKVADFNKNVKAANVEDVISDIRNTISGASLPTAGYFGDKLSGIPGTAANDIRSNIDTLKAAASFGSLQAMREASKTGSALGAVSDTEIKLLSAEIASLEQSQSPEQFARNLERFERTYRQIVDGPEGSTGGANSGSQPQPQQPAPVAGSEIDALLQKYSAP